ncbi:GNAT family N-acetyltransferase [Neisseria leonii]|uniref:GNAT family N-acetyltransferase n=1 Tax=Neisseria leonii TaxID=2995413 RepID=UPI00237B0923|nr:GNAT family N-acetyltransferase [Neisseria sp. 3986]MDD9326215.1 GNAT family N-acetyltransferase [Neisseria sp. 3986]
MNVTVCPLSSEYEAEWLPLWQAYLDFYHAALSRETAAATWRRIMQSADIKGFGAFDAYNRLVGFAHIVIHPNTWNIGKCCYLEDLFVAEDCRRQGVARSLIEAVYRFAETEKLNRVYWVADKNNTAAQALYNQMANQTAMVQYRKDFP